MPCPNRYTSTAALWPLRIILALETVTISNFQRLSLAASPNRPPKFPAFRQIPASLLPFPRFFASRRVAWCTRWISYGIFEIGTRWIVSYFFSFEWKRDWKRIRNLKRFFERVFCLFVCMICMVFSRFLLLEEGEECSEKFSILSIALRSFSFFYIGRVLWIFIEMENIGKYKYKFWSVKFYIFLQLLIDIRYLYNYKFLLLL